MIKGGRSYRQRNIFFLGDSKTAGIEDDNTIVTFTLWELRDRDRGQWRERPLRHALSGRDTATIKNEIDAVLAARTDVPEYVLINLGANDVLSLPVEATWKANTLYIWDAIHAKWPDAQIYAMRVWRRTYETNFNILAGWLADVQATRSSFVHLGPDERIFLENGDNGVTYTADGTHQNIAGAKVGAVKWRELLIS